MDYKNISKHSLWPKTSDLTGHKFKTWTVIGFAGYYHDPSYNLGKAMWACRCDCGIERVRPASTLKRNGGPSCFCQTRDDLVGVTFGDLKVIANGELGSRLVLCLCRCGRLIWKRRQALKKGQTKCRRWCCPVNKFKSRRRQFGPLWLGVKSRCYNPSNHNYQDYGGRGIGMSDEWNKSYMAFESDLLETIGPRPIGCTLDRIDVNRGYFKDNLRWATPKEQMRNRRPFLRIPQTGQKPITRSFTSEQAMLDWLAARLAQSTIEHDHPDTMKT